MPRFAAVHSCFSLRLWLQACLFLSLLCAIDSLCRKIPVAEIMRVYNGVEYSTTLHKYTQKQGIAWDYEQGNNCLSFYAGNADTGEHRTFDFICESKETCQLWSQFLNTNKDSGGSSQKVV